MSAKLLLGTEEAKCEASAVRVLAKMVNGSSSSPIDVSSMGGASIQISAKGQGLSIPLARNAAIEAAKSWAAGNKEALKKFEYELSEALKRALLPYPDLLEGSRSWW